VEQAKDDRIKSVQELGGENSGTAPAGGDDQLRQLVEAARHVRDEEVHGMGVSADQVRAIIERVVANMVNQPAARTPLTPASAGADPTSAGTASVPRNSGAAGVAVGQADPAVGAQPSFASQGPAHQSADDAGKLEQPPCTQPGISSIQLALVSSLYADAECPVQAELRRDLLVRISDANTAKDGGPSAKKAREM